MTDLRAIREQRILARILVNQCRHRQVGRKEGHSDCRERKAGQRISAVIKVEDQNG